MITLRGMTWNHPRGFDPMVATSAVWRERSGVDITWDKRSLQDFETFPVEQLARQYDLIVIDHPHVGQITAEGCLAPLDIAGRESDREALADRSVGHSYSSYTWQGRQWALPIDAAAQVQVFRPDKLERPAERWSEVIALARVGQVLLPMLPPHGLMTFFTLAANAGTPCATTHGELIEPRTGVEVVSRLAEICRLIEPENFAMDPIAASEAMSQVEPRATLMPLGYGYVNYAVDGFRPHRLQFADIPLPNATGAALGGTGIAVSAHSANRQVAADYAYWVASGDVQRRIYAVSGGQPGNSEAWDDETLNAMTHGFYRATRRTLEGAWVRPRHDGYMGFQDAAARRLNAGLLSDEPPAKLVAALNTLFRESF